MVDTTGNAIPCNTVQAEKRNVHGRADRARGSWAPVLVLGISVPTDRCVVLCSLMAKIELTTLGE